MKMNMSIKNMLIYKNRKVFDIFRDQCDVLFLAAAQRFSIWCHSSRRLRCKKQIYGSKIKMIELSLQALLYVSCISSFTFSSPPLLISSSSCLPFLVLFPFSHSPRFFFIWILYFFLTFFHSPLLLHPFFCSHLFPSLFRIFFPVTFLSFYSPLFCYYPPCHLISHPVLHISCLPLYSSSNNNNNTN